MTTENEKPKEVLFCSNLSKEFLTSDRRFPALKGLTFSVYDGEFVCVLGPSGCGKSTLLRLVAGLIPKSSGTISYAPHNPSRPHTAMVFQSQGLFPWKNVLDNAAFGLEMQGVDKPTRENQSIEFLTRVGLRNFLKAYPFELSGGMRQRVAISRAFLANPELLLMDEPFGMLDAQTRILMQEELLSIWYERKSTIIYITHDIEEAIFLGDRILVMSGRPGKFIADISIDFSRPRERAAMIKNTMDTREAIWKMLRDEVAREMESVA